MCEVTVLCVCVCGVYVLCVCVCVCVCVVCACLSVCLFRNHQHSRDENFQTVSVGDAYLIIMLPQTLLRPTL